MNELANEERYHVAGTSGHSTGNIRVLKHGDTFLVANPLGNIEQRGLGEQGLYHRGTRYISKLRLRLERQEPLLLSSAAMDDNARLAVDVTNPDIHREGAPPIPHGTVHLARSVVLRDGAYREVLSLANYGGGGAAVILRIDFAADFADIFEVRGTSREKRGERLPSTLSGSEVELTYMGLDGMRRATRFLFAPPPDTLTDCYAEHCVRLEPGETRSVELFAECESSEGDKPRLVESVPPIAETQKEDGACRIVTTNAQFNEWINRSTSDLNMLVTRTPHGRYPYAGVPWFSTVFGRDGIITALQTLWMDPGLARGVLGFLSAHQATEFDAAADAEPGKILHELREGEMAALREIPFGRYYGSIDSTPLYVMLAHRYTAATGDRQFLEAIWPMLLRAMDWIEQSGDVDDDGFVEYGRRSSDGLVQQGWKDSHDSVFHADGSPAEAPIALCEVQGYAYAARAGMASLARQLGEPGLAERWREQAERLRQRFDRAFWCDDLGTYALALDAKKRPCRVRTSNAAHCLFTGIALPERGGPLARQLLSPELFSGWGLRTLAVGERRFNPMSYHNGSVWPHDTAIAAEGLARYGHRGFAARILTALFDVALSMESRRLPELFCGFERERGRPPTRYPVACSPQAWASGSVFMLLHAVLGIEIDGEERRVVFRRPVLPAFIDQLEIFGLRVGAAQVNLRLRRYPEDVGVTVIDADGEVEVVSVR